MTGSPPLQAAPRAQPASLRTRLADAFLAWGWLTPALLPLANLGGRGLFHSLFYLYILWALSAASRLRLHGPQPALGLYLALLLGYGLSIPGAEVLPQALKAWGSLLCYSASALISLAMVQRDPANLERLLGAFARCGLLALGLAYLELAWLLTAAEAFHPRLDLHPVNLLIYLPFSLAWLWSLRLSPWTRRGLALFGVGLLLGYGTLAGERASLVSLILGLLAVGIALGRLRPAWVLLVLGLVPALALLFNGETLLRGWHGGEAALWERLDALSSGRLSLWQQALERSPDSPWFGVGMHNTRYLIDVVTIDDVLVKHLHNLWLDAWSDTGWVGLGLLLLTLGHLLSRLPAAWRRTPVERRWQLAALFGGVVVLLTQSQFSISYSSREIGIYLFTWLLLLAQLARDPASPPRP